MSVTLPFRSGFVVMHSNAAPVPTSFHAPVSGLPGSAFAAAKRKKVGKVAAKAISVGKRKVASKAKSIGKRKVASKAKSIGKRYRTDMLAFAAPKRKRVAGYSYKRVLPSGRTKVVRVKSHLRAA
jgi:hypothetical protein